MQVNTDEGETIDFHQEELKVSSLFANYSPYTSLHLFNLSR